MTALLRVSFGERFSSHDQLGGGLYFEQFLNVGLSPMPTAGSSALDMF